MSNQFPERFGRYTLLQEVAKGGMAEILLAIEDTPHAGKRFVTIKRIREDYATDPDYIDFFISEGKVSMRCCHPNLTSTIDLDTVGDVHYLAMEYIRGHTLLDLIRTSYRKSRFISPATSVAIAIKIAMALDHLHDMKDEQGTPMSVIHRDVTPQNIMIDASGTVKLIDFGIARSDVQVHKTRAGTVKGKLSYIAPELLVKDRSIDQRADLFALGIVLHETLTLRGLFRGKSESDTLKRILNMKVPKVSDRRNDVPENIDIFLKKALQRDPDKRFQTAAKMLVALQALDLSLAQTKSLARGTTAVSVRDEVLEICGDPKVPILGGESFSVLKEALRADPDTAESTNQVDLQYFLDRAGLNVEEAKKSEMDMDREINTF